MNRSLVTGLLAAALAGPSAAATAERPAPTLILVGDSTLAPQTGYGDALCARWTEPANCLNLARGGRSTRSYRDDGTWQRVLARLKAAPPEGGTPVVLIQFGHNDQPGRPGRSTDLATEFPANLERYVAEVRAAGGRPLLSTPLTRRSFRDGELVGDLDAWAEVIRGVAKRLGIPLIDTLARSAALVRSLGQARADELATFAPGSPGFDRTHVGPRGACVFAEVAARELAAQVPAVAAALLPGPPCEREPAAPTDVAPLSLDAHGIANPGWAVTTLGGRGGRIVRVTQLGASGPGSLTEALLTPGARTIVFEVGGSIDLQGRSLTVRDPFVTLAGQTAPSPGITLIKGELNIATHDVIVQHLAFRPGAYGRARRSGNDHDGISTHGGAHHVIVDHCSFSWATDENLSASGPRFEGPDVAAWRRATSHDLTYSQNLIAEGLGDSVHVKGEHSKGTLVHDNVTGILLLGNVYASNRERNALFKGGVHAAMVNNLIVNPGARAVHYNLVAHEWQGQAHVTGRLALVGNVLRHGPDTPEGTPLFTLGGAGDVELHLEDNLARQRQGAEAPLTGRYTAGAARILPAAEPMLPPRLRAQPAAGLEDRLLAVVGARPWDRDPVDQRLLSDIVEDRTRLIDDESQVGGHPHPAPTQARFEAARWRLADMSPRDGWASLVSARRTR